MIDIAIATVAAISAIVAIMLLVFAASAPRRAEAVASLADKANSLAGLRDSTLKKWLWSGGDLISIWNSMTILGCDGRKRL